MKRLVQKVRAVAQTYTRALDGFRAALDVHELRAWFERSVSGGSGFGFNGDVLRARIVTDLYRAAQCTAFVETGTFRGTTTILAARLFGGKVWSCELDPWSWFIASLRCLPYARIRVVRQDSRKFLRGMAERLAPTDVPMFYLDAHWNADLPLRDEVDLILATWRRCIIVVDDFEVPRRPGFKFDVYEGTKLSLELLGSDSAIKGKEVCLYFPDYEPSEDTGARCGYVVVAKGIDNGGSRAGFRVFPLSKLKLDE